MQKVVFDEVDAAMIGQHFKHKCASGKGEHMPILSGLGRIQALAGKGSR
jgi:hypothetical protein